MPPARLTAATTSRQWLKAKIGNSRPISRASCVRMTRIVRSARANLQHVLGSGYGAARDGGPTGSDRRLAGGTRAAETAARKQRLLDAATALAAEGGYDAVQMRDVAARAEVALGTLYRHYASKDQLLLAALAAPGGDAARAPRPTAAARRRAGRPRRRRAAPRDPRARTPAARHARDGHRDVGVRRQRRAGEARDRRDAAGDHRRRGRRHAGARPRRHRARARLGVVRRAHLLERRPHRRARRWPTTSPAPPRSSSRTARSLRPCGR